MNNKRDSVPVGRAAHNLVGIQWLRGFSAFLVLLFHTTEQMFVQGLSANNDYVFHLGTRGVDLFFVISGFIIGYVHHKDLDRPQTLPIYGIKRLGRIFPLYWALLIPAIIVKLLLPVKGPEDTVSQHLLETIFLLPQPQLPLLGVAWTLSFELFFYGLFALAIWKRRVGVFVGVLVVAGCLMLPYFDARYNLPFLAKFIFSPFILEFSFGVVVAVVFSKWRSAISLKIVGVIIAPAACLLLLSQIPGFVSLQRPAIWGGIGALLTYFLCVYGDRLNSRNYWWTRPAEYLGLATYSIYLIHYPIMIVWCKLWKRFAPSHEYICGVSAIILSIGVGILVYFFIEAPQQKLISRVVKWISTRMPPQSTKVITTNAATNES